MTQSAVSRAQYCRVWVAVASQGAMESAAGVRYTALYLETMTLVLPCNGDAVSLCHQPRLIGCCTATSSGHFSSLVTMEASQVTGTLGSQCQSNHRSIVAWLLTSAAADTSLCRGQVVHFRANTFGHLHHLAACCRSVTEHLHMLLDARIILVLYRKHLP